MLTVTGAGEPEQLPMARVTAGLFQVLGVPRKRAATSWRTRIGPEDRRLPS